MVNPHHLAHWYPTAAYLYVFWLDALALAWEYLRRHPDYRLDWLRRHRRPEAAHRWGLRLLEDPMLDARDAHPAWLPGHAAVVQLYPDADPPQDATVAAWSCCTTACAAMTPTGSKQSSAGPNSTESRIGIMGN